MNSVEFLLKVWRIHCVPGDFVAVSAKGNKWKDYTFPFDDDLESKLGSWISTHSAESLYFCPLPFTEARRKKESVARSKMLWSDIDDADPYKVEPSILWESSPGRFQGLWLLPRTLEPEAAAEGSRNMAYYIGADRGGWDLTQVLRIPGTKNYKYDPAPTVKLIHFKSTILKKIPQRLIDRYRSSIPRKVMQILEGPATVGKRSDMLWYLEHELCDQGIPIKDVISIIRDTDWNKYRGRADEEERFTAERDKIIGDRVEKGTVTKVENSAFRIETYSDVLGSIASAPGWLVKGFWMKGSHGIIAGEPKSFKSTLSLDLLFSIASTKPFLGAYPVEFGGPCLIIQNENADWIMRDRLEKLAVSRGEVGKAKYNGSTLKIEWARQLPLFFINQQGFNLNDAAYRVQLEDMIATLQPAVVQLDPMYLMFDGDINSAQDLQGVLAYLLDLKNRYGCAIQIIHHYNKGGESKRGGQRMLGSTTLHGWIESAWYVQATENEGSVVVSREFRGAGIHEALQVSLTMGDFGDPHYLVTVGEAGGPGLEDEQVLGILAQSTDAMSKRQIRQSTGLSVYQLDKIIEKLMKSEQITRKGERYAIQ